MAVEDQELAFGAEYNGNDGFDIQLDVIEHGGNIVEMDTRDYHAVLSDIYGFNHLTTHIPLVIIIEKVAYEVTPMNGVPYGTIAFPKALAERQDLELPKMNSSIEAATLELAAELTGISL